MTYRVLDIFSGIGGFSLGLECAGMSPVAFVEIDPFCRDILARHWPGVPIHDDVLTLSAEWLAEHAPRVDVICGGFPCQDVPEPGSAPDYPAHVRDSTGNWCAPFAWFDPRSRLWRTWQRCLETGWATFSGIWPRAGLVLNGIAFQRRPSAPLTRETAFGSLPTPRARMTGAVTPERAFDKERNLETALARAILPTPSHREFHTLDPDKILARREKAKARGHKGNGFGLTLGNHLTLLAAGKLPTPTASMVPRSGHAPREIVIRRILADLAREERARIAGTPHAAAGATVQPYDASVSA